MIDGPLEKLRAHLPLQKSHSINTRAHMTILSALVKCFLSGSVSQELGGGLSWFSIGWDCLTVLALQLCHWLFLKEQRSTMLTPDVRLFGLASSRMKRHKLVHGFRCITFLLAQNTNAVRRLGKRWERGGTNSALCLSSARIWSLGFRAYLQVVQEKEASVSASNKEQVL